MLLRLAAFTVGLALVSGAVMVVNALGKITRP